MRSHLASIAFLSAMFLATASPGVGRVGPCAADDCGDEDCASEDQANDDRADHDEAGSPDDCSPGCNAGCACCARVSALPVTSLPLLLALELSPAEHEVRMERAPTTPEPADRDAVPRA